jgi:hypothetical protein
MCRGLFFFGREGDKSSEMIDDQVLFFFFLSGKARWAALIHAMKELAR